MGAPVLAINDAWRAVPWAELLYAADAKWWDFHRGAPGYRGEKWSTHGTNERTRHNDKSEHQARYGLRLVLGADGSTFSDDPTVIHYGSNSGFQAVNLALLMGARRIALVGFDMHGTHFFGRHPAGLRNATSYASFIRAFSHGARRLPADRTIINCTPGSALTCFPMGDLADEERRLFELGQHRGCPAQLPVTDQPGACEGALFG